MNSHENQPRKQGRVMVRLIVILVLAMFAYFTVRNLFKSPSRKVEGKRPEDAGSRDLEDQSEMAQDPVCGTYVQAETSPSLVRRGQRIYFCSDECMKKFMDSDKG
ncbi:MAG: YHS domain-containing protein [bacterium]